MFLFKLFPCINHFAPIPLSHLWYNFNHCVKSVHIRSYSGPYFPAFGLNMDRYSVLRISPYSVRMRENTDQNNSEYGHFLRSEYFSSHTEKSNKYFEFDHSKISEKEKFTEINPFCTNGPFRLNTFQYSAANAGEYWKALKQKRLLVRNGLMSVKLYSWKIFE